MGTTAEKLAYLTETKTAIKNAIVSKGTDVPEGTTFRGYADLISGISTGLSDDALALASATPEDVLTGKTFYAVNKNLKTGTALSTPITANESDVNSGKTYYDNNGVLKTGTARGVLKVMAGSASGGDTIYCNNISYVAAGPYSGQYDGYTLSATWGYDVPIIGGLGTPYYISGYMQVLKDRIIFTSDLDEEFDYLIFYS